MSLTRNTFFTGIGLLLFLLIGTQLSAQCDLNGHVLSPPNSNVCGKVIYSYDSFELLVPNDDSVLEGYSVGTEILFSYEVDSVAGSCSIGPSVNVTCVHVASLPTSDCLADFSYNTNSFDLSPEVTFFPEVVNSLLAYNWNFGDGTTAYWPGSDPCFPRAGFL